MTNSSPQSESCRDERFVRWDQIRRDQFSFLSNLLLAFALAADGLLIDIVFRDCPGPGVWISRLAAAAIVLFSTSIGIGIWLACNRLKDFRLTAKEIRDEKQSSTLPDTGSQSQTSEIGKRSWSLLTTQITTFAVAALTVILMIILRISGS